MKIEERLAKIEQKVEGILQLMQKQQEEPKTVKKVSGVDRMAVKLYARTLEGLSNPIRVAILNKLAERGAYYHELEKLTGLSPAPLSFHLKSLKSSGLVYQEAKRGRYLVSELGVKLLELIKQMADALYKFETADLDRYCFLCGKAKMKIDVFPIYFRIWCPGCGGEHGSKWSFTLSNPFGEEWRRHGVEKLLEIGWKETFKLMKKTVRASRCINCNAQIKYVFHDDRIEAECPLCGEHYSMQINDLTPERLFPLWKKHKRIQQKTEGPLEKDGITCWKITVTNERNEIIAIQYVKVGKGEEVAWEESDDSQTTALPTSETVR